MAVFQSSPFWRGRMVVALLAIAGVLTGCDLPTEPLSVETRTTISAPLIENKTFQFLGDLESIHTPLIDTARMDLDTLLAGLRTKDTILVEESFTYSNTVNADLSGLAPLADADENRIVGSTPLRIEYDNGMPIRFDVGVDVLDEGDRPILTIEEIQLDPAPKSADGTAASVHSDRVVLDLRKEEVRSLARGQSLRLDVRGVPAGGSPARVLLSDTLQVSLSTAVETTIRVGGRE